MKIKDEWIRDATEALEKEIVKDGQYDRVFKGYISSFGAAIIQAGLLPAILFFEQEKSETNAQSDRAMIIRAVIFLLHKKRNGKECTEEGKLARYLMKHQKEQDRLLKEVSEAAVALKLALRMFKEKTN